MKKVEHLWGERLQSYAQELRRYARYMFNDHLLFVVIFGLGAGGYYYTNWVKTLDAAFPIGWVMGIILAFFATISPIYTLLRRADVVFLLPLEIKLKSYFQKAIRLSFFVQAYVLLMVLAVLMPMYAQVSGNGFRSFFPFFLILLILKAWNLLFHWQFLKTVNTMQGFRSFLTRFLMNAVLLFLVIEAAAWWLISLVVVLFLVVLFYMQQVAKTKTLKWELLIEKEEQRMTAFYRLANLFTDVPKLKGQVKRRKWLDGLYRVIRFDKKNTFTYLYARTFIRTNEYFGLFIRLTLIASLLLFFSDSRYVVIGIAILFLYLTGFQFIPMLRYHELKIWINLYPVSNAGKEKAFLSQLQKILLVQSLVFAIVAAASGAFFDSVIILGLGVIFTFVFVKWYAPQRIRKMQRLY
ncbi:ABC transporter permease [Bacillus chungangensis]|uniref:ABC-2 type transport system permease protein n=1 Tax=Bacillus chungangensis TaxID=587633 RepID=A0ABT9WNL3_9BACI|nr:ABC transporter permease [Bacillus chungangensis]MDQ0174781.1 ABC-2 type transport system permease protein [Bacillus chungangensis]